MVQVDLANAARIAARTADTETELARAAGRLSSGRRVETASDDASSLAIGARLEFERASLEIVRTDLSLTESRVQIIDGALSRVGELLTRMNTLAVQATNGVLSDLERALLDTEFVKLREEIDRIGKDASFAGAPLSGGVVFNSEFDSQSDLDSVTLLGTGGPGLPVVNNGQVELTNLGDGFGTAGFVSNDTFALRGGLTAEFRYFAGSPAAPADGLTFFLVDGEGFTPGVDVLGGGGGDLGYRGIAGGFIGVAFDEFGNFVNGPFNTPSFGFQPDTVSVAIGDSVEASSITDVSAFGGIGGGFRDVRLDISSDLRLNVEVSFDNGDSFVSILDDFDLSTSVNNAPETLRFGFSASVGGLSNDYFIDRATVITAGEFTGIAGAENLADEDRLSVPLFNLTAASFGVSDSSIRTQAQAEAAISSVSFGLDQLAAYRANIGSVLSVVEGVQQSNDLNVLNLEQARSQLIDADVPRGIVAFIQQSLLSSTSLEMLSSVHDLQRFATLGLIDTIEV